METWIPKANELKRLADLASSEELVMMAIPINKRPLAKPEKVSGRWSGLKAHRR